MVRRIGVKTHDAVCSIGIAVRPDEAGAAWGQAVYINHLSGQIRNYTAVCRNVIDLAVVSSQGSGTVFVHIQGFYDNVRRNLVICRNID